MTMPSLIQKYRDKELIVRTKRVYSNIQNAVSLAQKENDVVGDNTFLFDPTKTSAEVAANFVKYFNGSMLCTKKRDQGCDKFYYTVKYATRRKNDTTGVTMGTSLPNAKIILNDGSLIAVNQMTSCERTFTDCKRDSDYNCIKDKDGNTELVTKMLYICAYIEFDVNGPSLPNQFGRDVYELEVYKDKISPNLSNLPGGKSLKNILTGIDKLEYTEYNIGETD